MASYWLLKTEPDCYAWSQMQKDGHTFWDGVHNYQARNFLRMMKRGDRAFFYHTGDERRIMGIVEIVKEAYPDLNDPVWSWVDVECQEAFQLPIGLDQLKNLPELRTMKLFKQGRLSVVPITGEEWNFICKMGGVS